MTLDRKMQILLLAMLATCHSAPAYDPDCPRNVTCGNDLDCQRTYKDYAGSNGRIKCESMDTEDKANAERAAQARAADELRQKHEREHTESISEIQLRKMRQTHANEYMNESVLDMQRCVQNFVISGRLQNMTNEQIRPQVLRLCGNVFAMALTSGLQLYHGRTLNDAERQAVQTTAAEDTSHAIDQALKQ